MGNKCLPIAVLAISANLCGPVTACGSFNSTCHDIIISVGGELTSSCFDSTSGVWVKTTLDITTCDIKLPDWDSVLVNIRVPQ